MTTSLQIAKPRSWEDDRQARFQCGPLTESFHRAVPVLAYLNWSIDAVDLGKAVTTLPLTVESSNQYITQQAALMLLAADYTGGIALSTLFPETPVIGFHAQKDGHGAYMWGAQASIKWLRPSTEDITCRASIPAKHWGSVAETFARGEEVRHRVRIKMHNGDRLVAVSDFDYWARSARSLRATGRTIASTHHMLTHKLNTSARLIAGLRAPIRCPENDDRALDPYAARAAGAQGIAMAEKFSRDTPQLAALVKARTLHCDAALRQFARKHARCVVVNLGCGYDARPWRMEGLGDVTFLELDLAVMLRERESSLPASTDSPYRVIRRPFDILADDLGRILEEARLPADVPRFFIWEGGSMYFEAAVADALLGTVRRAMPRGSQMWLDFVTSAAVDGTSGLPESEAFIHSMRVIGEPFVRGFEDPAVALSELGFADVQCTLAANVLESEDPVCKHYGFLLLST